MAFFPILIFDVVNAQDSWSIAIHLQYVSGNYSLLLYYQAYTKIIDGYPAPQLLSLGFNYKINSSLTLS